MTEQDIAGEKTGHDRKQDKAGEKTGHDRTGHSRREDRT
jgi:hypothetical protein